MKQKNRILVTVILLSLLTSGVGIFYFVHPLAQTSALEVIYGEGEDFSAHADVYQNIFNRGVYYLHLPSARPAYRWWAIDFSKPMIYLSGTVHSFPFERKFVLRGDAFGAKIDDKAAMGEWYWHFTENGAALSGNGFTCKVSRQ